MALADDAYRDLQRLRSWLAQLPEPDAAAVPLVDDWSIAERGLFGPDGILAIVTAASQAVGASVSTPDPSTSTSDAGSSAVTVASTADKGRGVAADAA